MPDTTIQSDTFSALANFKIREVDFKRPAAKALAATAKPTAKLDPNLGPLTAFVGTFVGRGFNTIFRPDNPETPTFPPPVNTDNVLELNLTEETLSFSKTLGSVPNRGSGKQGDVFLNAVPYLQSINDVTSQPANGIHFEPGLWLSVPSTNDPSEPPTLARMASIPHGTTIIAQGTVLATVPGKPTIAPVDITPFVAGKPNTPANQVKFPSQTASNEKTSRLPQDLAPFVTAGTITQAMLCDPNTVLRNQIEHQTITETVVIGISTTPQTPLVGGPLAPGPNPAEPPAITPDFGGGPANIAFLLGAANPPPNGNGPNAQTLQMDAVFWIETVSYQIEVPALPEGSAPVLLTPVATNPPTLQPSFVASIPFVPGKKFAGGTVTVQATQIQYTQKVILNFNGLSWPHVSVATLVPSDPIAIPAHLLPLT